MDLFFRSLIIGLSVAAVVGPMSVLCIQRTLHRGFFYGLISGLGVATADAAYGSIAAFGLTLIAKFLVNQHKWISLIGGLFLVYLGIKAVLSKPGEQAVTATKATGFSAAYASTFLLTLTNPLTILSFAAIFAGIGVGEATSDTLTAILVVCGVFLGSALWWCLLTGAIGLLRGKFAQAWLLWINRLSGGVIAIFGLVTLLTGVDFL
jgi:threonine/homoserine/homoserine lactone efflux protein